ncbi:MAG TPA: S1 RNA-binding domain-containing protein, partial [Pyrinomonadaceae bacterium]|nr:S1 RNA-binding domain-containing protein [Pyrinomonadaceae bacterium]
GYKSEGIVPIEDFTSPSGEVTVSKGEMVEVIIKSISSGDAPPTLSRADAVSRKSWDVVEKAFNSETPITGRVVEVTKGGLRVDINGVEAFLPGSQVDSRPIRNLNSFVGQDLEAKVIKFSRKRNNIVLSRKVLTDEVVNKQKAETLGNIEEGFIIEGTIKNLTEYGAFVDIGGIDGLLHVTDMSWGRLQNPGDQFKVGDTMQVKVLKLDREKEKVALGYKQLIPDPWSTVMEIYPINAKIKGRVSSVTDYGAFIELEPGVEGLVHVSEMSWSKRSQSPKKIVRSGDEVEVQVLGIDTDDRRISLGMKQLQANPWQTVHERYRIGQTVRGKVRNLTDFGAFIEIEDGIDGLVHISDISHSKKIKHPKDVLKRDQEVEAVIRNIDTENRRMSLSIKELTPSAWEQFVSMHKPGDVVRGRISRFTGFGVFVELGNELEGLCHISELSDERIERPEDIGTIGQEMDFKILRIEQDTQKIGLSARAVGKEEEPMIDTKSYSTEAKSGMASLGELMNLKRSGGSEDNREEQPRLSKKERRALQAQERAEQERLAAERPAEPEQNAEPEATEVASGEAETVADAGTDAGNNQSSIETASETGSEPIVSETAAASESITEPSAETPVSEQEVSPVIESAPASQSESAGTDTESADTEASSTTAETSGENVDETLLEISDANAEPLTETVKADETNSTQAAGEGEVAGDTQAAGNITAGSFDIDDDNDLLELNDNNSAEESKDSGERTANG